MAISPELEQKLNQLQEKYAASGQDMLAYIDGLLYADYLTYWDYIEVDTLLTLQKPKTSFPDEEIFIMYHQITELYFKLSLHELKQIASKEPLTAEFYLNRVKRINRYFEALTHSFEIMVDGMDKDQFLKFRMSLLPASGFQSAQYRMIEIMCAPFLRLVDKDKRAELENASVEEQFKHIYWQQGATELASGEKTLTLKQFEKKYGKQFLELAQEHLTTNLWMQYKKLPEADQNNQEIINELRWIDQNVNVNWPLSHYKSAVRYLQKNPEDIAATGGTNWQKYLPPRFQKRIFYPELWQEQELEEWGKSWVKREVFNITD